ncbi:MAG TPA: hypothetical protein VFG69_03345 [Nannocystaceae bacterium]|nr:hypothetical protein [Nannocystaceae bacterium]
MACRRLLALALALTSACTEPNPFAGDESSGDPTSSSTSTSTGSTGAPIGTDETSASPMDSSGGGTSSGTDDATTGSVACPIGTHVCVTAAPEGWSGPSAIMDEATRAPEGACAAPYPVWQAIGFDDLDAPAAECGCSCAGPMNAGCSNLQLVRDNSAGCGSPSATWNLDTQNCYTAPEGTANQYWQATTGGLDTGTCTAQPTTMISPAVFGGRHRLCGTGESEPGTCDGSDVCSPIPVAPFGGDLCIWRDGDEPCPPDIGYDARRLIYGDKDDQRACSTCSCGLSGECTGVVYLFGSDGCGGDFAAGTAVFDGLCVQVPSNVTEVDVSNLQVDAACTPSGGQSTGVAVGSAPITVCCRE